jgi:hypothetical protein
MNGECLTYDQVRPFLFIASFMLGAIFTSVLIGRFFR